MGRIISNCSVVEFQRIAGENGLTYAQLQILETCGKVKIINKKLVWLDKDRSMS